MGKAGFRENHAPEAGFRELPVALPIVPQRVGDGSGMLRNGYSRRRFFHDGVRRGSGRGGRGGGTRRSNRSERRDRVVDGVEEEARAESPRGGGGGGAAPPHGDCRCGVRAAATTRPGGRRWEWEYGV